MAESAYLVAGMACGHCVESVTEEVALIPGVTGVRVDLDAGSVTVTSERELSAAEVHQAITEAGYDPVP